MTASDPIVTASGTIPAGDWQERLDAAVQRLSELAPQGGVVAFVAIDVLESAALVLAAGRAGVFAAPMSPRLPQSALQSAADRIRATMLDSGSPADPASLPADYRGRGGVVVHTSGSSGTPRAALLTAESLQAGARGVVAHLDLRPGDRWLLSLPLHHVSGVGVLFRCTTAGATVAVPEPGASTIEAIESLRPTHVSLVSTQLFRALRERPGPAPTGLRAVLLGGGPTPAGMLDEAAGRGWPVSNSYGLTEMGSTVTATSLGAGPDELGTAGRPLLGRVVRTYDGEIRVAGDGLFEGYLSDGRLERPLDAGGLFPTGDVGALDDAGRLVVAGRVDNRFISGGENVQPEEVEAALAALPGVVRAVVLPVPDAEFGLRGVAYVETADGSEPDGRRLTAALAERVERFKIPVRFHAWPAGEGLKVSRREIAARSGE